MKISIVIPAFNEERYLPATLASVGASMTAFTDLGWAAELVVCDNNSGDRTAEIARAAGAIVVFEPINHISRARNTGAAAATGDWLVFVDADSHPTRELCAAVARAIRGGRCLAGGSTVVCETGDLLVRLVVGGWNMVSRAARWAAGSFIFCDAAAFRDAGGFSTELYAAEEIDLFRRLKRLARQRRKTVVILSDHPLRTSDRKARLYTPSEMLRFMAKTIITGGRTLRSPQECFAWYDGRR